MKNSCTRAIYVLVLVLICVQVLAPAPALAFSFSTWLGNDDDGTSGTKERSTADGSLSRTASSDEVSLSDGTDLKPQQPLVDADAWFLTE
ncbi:hypothetical protein PF010_g26621 [Phytophthora fragariae]|uniref:RxLR effector protein n=1 Tax=Phytophthora fragariae TaxID=53985 RepID=A0A6A3WBR0_9STRA|nr:hypothetical protein PF003_g14615 [Phytophthora fragariae]KAE9069541.1 hypothetical protein PF010_g26621 [Phytophthora fragariae]KAE9179898.1 hypothetical protein PF002_g27697 [Phytophthora fragariae]